MRTKPISEDTQQILTTIARFMKEYRLQSGYTQEELSEISEIHYNTIHSIESGESFNIVSLVEVCLALDLPFRELFWEV